MTNNEFLSSWYHGPERKKPTEIAKVICGKPHAVNLQEHVHMHTDGVDLAMMTNQNEFEPESIVCKLQEHTATKRPVCVAVLEPCCVAHALFRRLPYRWRLRTRTRTTQKNDVSDVTPWR